MNNKFPSTSAELLHWKWHEIEPFYQELVAQNIDTENLTDWLQAWSDLADHTGEQFSRLYVATTVNTEDSAAEKALQKYLETTYVKAPVYEQKLKEKLLSSGLVPEGLAIQIRNMRAEAELYREENLSLLAEEKKLDSEYDKLSGARTVFWDGEERTLPQMKPVFIQEPNRERREEAWRLVRERILADQSATHDLWRRYFEIRTKIHQNADQPDYRSYIWQKKFRFEYTPAHCKAFHTAIEEVVVPVVGKIYEKRRQQLGVETLRPWDLDIDPLGRPPLQPFKKISQLINGTGLIFDQVDSNLSQYFRHMMENSLLDLENRKGKAPGGYCTTYPIKREPFIFMNAVGLHEDMQTLLHEAGHAFHAFESGRLPYHMQFWITPMEFNEVASMAMEYLAAPYLEASGRYSASEAARARIEHLESSIIFWAYMALVDAFQHWIYENPDLGQDASICDQKWIELNQRFNAGVDYNGLEKYIPARWHVQLHIHQVPFYYIEYGLAQLGAVQVWGNALENEEAALRDYLEALQLGGTVTLPELYQKAGAEFAFDATTLRKYVTLMERQIDMLHQQV